jgi:nucleoside-diphosphate-sugar epimerase
MRVLIVGGTRFIGAHVARRLFEQGAEVVVLHRGQSHNPILPAVRHVLDPAAEYPVTSFPREVTATDWDAVIHMVLMGEVDARAAAAAFTGRTGRLVVVSSGDVYRAYGRLTGREPGSPDPTPLTEDAPKRSVLYPWRGREAEHGAFARDYEKILAEQAVSEAAGLPWTILRLPKVYGPEDNAEVGTVYGFASRPDWRWTYGHVDNVAAAITLGATHPRAPGRTYNIGEPHTPTMGERLSRLPRQAQPAPEPPSLDYRQDMVQDTGRIRAELGFREVVDEADAMAALAQAAVA